MEPIQADEGTQISVTEEQAKVGIAALAGMRQALRGYSMQLRPGEQAHRDVTQTMGIIDQLSRRLEAVTRRPPGNG